MTLATSFADWIAGLGETIVVTTPDGSWRVPRIYIAAHGIAGAEVRTLAEVFAWERVTQ